MVKNISLSILFMVIGLYAPIVLYPFATPDSDAKIIQYALAKEGKFYEPKKINQLEIVLIDGKVKDKSNLFFKKEGHVAIPFKYIYAFGVTMFFIGATIHLMKRES